MRHEISQSEATAIRKARAEQAKIEAAKREKEEESRWLDYQEARAKTQ